MGPRRRPKTDRKGEPKEKNGTWVLRARKEITSQSETVRKLPRIDNRKSVNIRNMNRLTIVDPRGFGAVSDAEVISLRALRLIKQQHGHIILQAFI